MKTLIRYQFYIAALALAIFCWLAIASAHYTKSYGSYSSVEQNYTKSQRKSMDVLLARVDPQTLQERQAAALMEVWNISEEQVAQEVVLWK